MIIMIQLTPLLITHHKFVLYYTIHYDENTCYEVLALSTLLVATLVGLPEALEHAACAKSLGGAPKGVVSQRRTGRGVLRRHSVGRCLVPRHCMELCDGDARSPFSRPSSEDSGSPRSLRELRDRLSEDLAEALRNICLLLSVFTYARTYELVFQAVGQGALVAPACFSQLVGLLCPGLPVIPRFLASCLAFAGLCALPFLAGAAPFFVALAAVLLLGFASRCRASRATDEMEGWASPTLRPTWPNAAALAALLAEPALVSAALAALLGPDAEDARREACSHARPALFAGAGVTAVWLLLVSLMFVTGQMPEQKALQTHGLLRFLQLALSHALCLPVTFALLMPTACGPGSPYEAASLCTLAVYLATTQALSAECGLLEPPPEECGLDLRYAGRFLSGAEVLSVGMAVATMWLAGGGASSGRDPAAAAWCVAALAALALAWTLLYGLLAGAPVSSVPYVAVLRAGGLLGILGTASFLLDQRAARALPPRALLWGWAALAAAALAAAAGLRERERRRRQAELERSGIRARCQELLEAVAVAAVGRALVGERAAWRDRWRHELASGRAPQQLVLLLLEFERHVRVEGLTDGFLCARAAWRSELLRCRDFARLQALAERLQAGLRTPPTTGVLTACAAQRLGRRDLAHLVVDFVVGHRELRAQLAPALCCARSAAPKAKGGRWLCCRQGSGGLQMDVHLRRARGALASALRRFREGGPDGTGGGARRCEHLEELRRLRGGVVARGVARF